MRSLPRPWFVAALILPLGVVACSSISDSVESVSKSVTNAFDSGSDSSASSSDSSTGGGSKSAARYRTDLRAYTVASLSDPERRGEDVEFVRGIGRIAELHGITDWEGSVDTVVAIREAVASGAIDGTGVARLRRQLAPLGPQVVSAALPSQPEADPVAGTPR